MPAHDLSVLLDAQFTGQEGGGLLDLQPGLAAPWRPQARPDLTVVVRVGFARGRSLLHVHGTFPARRYRRISGQRGHERDDRLDDECALTRPDFYQAPADKPLDRITDRVA